MHNGLIDLMHIVQALNLPLDCKNEKQLQMLLKSYNIKFYDSRVHMTDKFGYIDTRLGQLASAFLHLDETQVKLHDAACDAFLTGQLIAKYGPVDHKNFCFLTEFNNMDESDYSNNPELPSPAQYELNHLSSNILIPFNQHQYNYNSSYYPTQVFPNFLNFQNQ